MKSKELVSYWSSPDNSRLTPKQYSFRLPVHVAAKIAALCDLYPSKSRTQIVGDLLATALEELEAALPSVEGLEPVAEIEGRLVYEDVGPRARYRDLVERYTAELEQEISGGRRT